MRQKKVEMIRWIVLGGVLFGLLFLSCQAGPRKKTQKEQTHLQHTQAAIIYGKDDRKEAVNHPDTKLQALSKAVALILTYTFVKTSDKGVVTLKTRVYNDRIKKENKGVGMCKSERFANQVTASGCTGFLIGKRILMTAGHCVDDKRPLLLDAQYWCNRKRFIFGFQTKKDGSLEPLTRNNVFRCKRVLRVFNNYKNGDFAVVELDRDVPATPLIPDYKPGLKKGDKVAVLGHPHGFPMKITDNATVGTITKPNYFSTNLDSYPGNSGSPVIALPSYKVVAVHVRGQRPNVTLDKKDQCYRWTVLPATRSGQTENLLLSSPLPTCQKDTDCAENHFCRAQQCILKTQDVRVERLIFSQSSGKQGDTVTVKVDVVNQGEITTPKALRMGLWWSQNKIICPYCKPCKGCLPDRLLDSAYVPILKARERKQLTFRFPVTPEFFTNNYIGAYVDDTKIWIENREDNNIAYQLFTTTAVTCQDGATQFCYHMAAGCSPQSNGRWQCQTPCKEGSQICKGGKWQPCTQAVYPSIEICDNKDNNCDGQIDEGFALGQTCNTGQGECQTQGHTVCGGKYKITCKANLPPTQYTTSQTQTIKKKSEAFTFTFKKIPKLQDPNGKIALKVRLEGDFGGSTEYVTLLVGSQKIGTVGKEKGWDCSTIHEQTVWVPSSLLQQQTLTVLVQASNDVEPRCKDKNEIKLSLQAFLRQELCDGKDNDCDGKIDNNAGTTEKLSKPCHKGPCSGQVRCINQQWLACDAPTQCPKPKAEPSMEKVTEIPEESEVTPEDKNSGEPIQDIHDAGPKENLQQDKRATQETGEKEELIQETASKETKPRQEKTPTPEPSVEAPTPGKQGCQCQSSQGAPNGMWWILLLFVYLLLRRRQPWIDTGSEWGSPPL